MLEQRLATIREKLERLRRLDPAGKALFGASEHRYHLNPPASEELLQRFESNLRAVFEEETLTLPEEYREFLLQVGNGGAGPYYGLWELVVVEQEDYLLADRVEHNGQFQGMDKRFWNRCRTGLRITIRGRHIRRWECCHPGNTEPNCKRGCSDRA